MPRSIPGTFNFYPQLREHLPALVRKQRRLERRLASVKADQLIADEKETRAQIDDLLIAAGMGKGEGVTCAGFDVVHNERVGQERVKPDLLRAAGVPDTTILECTRRDATAKFATVSPSKGAVLRRPL